MVEFDRIVVGAGSAGSVVSAGLADRGERVLVVEAGPRDRDPRIRIPAAAADLWFGRLDWAFDTVAQPGLGGRSDTWPRGRVVGGSSAINAMMHVRGIDADFDGWAAAGATGWDAAAMNAAFRRLEDDERGPAPHRGSGGPMSVERQRDPRPLSIAFLDACEELGIPRVEDHHVEPHGCALTMVSQRAGRRWTAADGFLTPRLADPGTTLTLRTGVEVVRVVVERGRAVGIEATVRGRRRVVRARRGVVLAAGAIGSPVLLQRSGIGDASHLGRLGIEVVVDRPAVGADLQDHLVAGMIGGASSGSLHGADRDPRALVRWLRERRGPLTSNLGEAIAFLSTRDGEPGPDIELIAIPAPLRDHGRVRLPQHGITVGAILLTPASRGSVRIASTDPSVRPLIDPNVLSEPDDLVRLVDGVRFVQRLLTSTRAMTSALDGLLVPPAPLVDDAALAEHVRAIAQTLYHPVGTCRMGSDDDAVVDPTLAVRGVEGLSVVDASVMPTIVRGHTNAPTMALALRAVDLLAGVP
jgi:choline dehydrogenase